MDPKLVAIQDVAASAEAGFVLVGSKNGNDHQANRAAIWRSDDGVSWTENVLETRGSLDSVAARGATVVAVGRTESAQRDANGRLEGTLAERTTDAGATWSPVALPEPTGSAKFVTRASAVAVSEAGFVTGGGAFINSDAGYQAWAARSADGETWELASSPDGTGTSRWLDSLARTAGGDVAAVRETIDGAQSTRFEVSDGASWVASKVPETPSPVSAGAHLAVGPSTDLMAVTIESTPAQGQLWRSTDGGKSFAKVDIPIPGTAQPGIFPSFATSTTVYGSAQGVDLAWPRLADGKFGTPLVLSEDPLDSFSGAVTGPNGTLVWSSFRQWSTGNAQTRLTTDGTNFTLSAPNEFNKVAQYHSSSISQVIWAHDRWVAVGTRSNNGDVRTSALAFTSANGTSWAPGTAAHTVRAGDTFGAQDVLTDLDGLENNGRSMASVAALKTGVVSVGWAKADGVSHASVWISSDMAKWERADLPLDGLASSSASSVFASGDLVVAVGSGQKDGATDSTGYVWTSTDAGKTWKRQALGADENAGDLLLTLTNGTFVVAQSQDHNKSLAGWTSKDGVTWTPAKLDLPGRSDKTRVSVPDLISNGDGVDLLLRVFNNTDGRTVLNHVKIG